MKPTNVMPVDPPLPAPQRRSNRALAAAIAVALGTAPPVFAADASDALEEIMVTANRRAQNVLDVPYNISAVSGQALASAGITSLTDIARLVPGINVPDLGPRAGSSNSNIIIRGMNANDPGSSAYLPWESVPLVATYVDEVPMFVNLNLSDIQRIEVLRGPQGTLYGSGAVAGTIRIIHNQPDPTKFDASLTLDGAETSHAANGSYTVDGLLNIPIADSVALRVNANYKETSGFIDASNAVVFGAQRQPALSDPTNPLGGGFQTQTLRSIDSALSTYFRASLLWHILPGVDATLAYQRQNDHASAFSRQSEGQHYTDGAYIPVAPDHRVVDLSSVTVSADVGFATVTSSSSFAKNHDNSGYDESPFLLNYNSLSPLYYGSFPRATTEFFTDSIDKSIVEELRLVSKEGGALDYVVGGFFRHEWNDLFQYETIPGFAAWSELPGSADAVNPLLGTQFGNFGDYITQYNGGTRPSSLSPTDTNYTYQRESGFKDRALYGELTWHVTPQWQITGGARVFWQNVDENLYQTIPYGGPFFSTLPPPANATDALGSTIAGGRQTFHNHLFKLNSGYALTPELRLYATYSEGFRHGGANANAIGTCAFCDSPNTAYFAPDTVKNYEVGLKGTAGNWLRFSTAVYRMHWNDIQIQLFDATDSEYVANGGTAVSQGVEAEIEGQLGRGFTANLGYGYTDAKVTGDFVITDRGQTLLGAHDGDRLPYVPEQTLTAGLGFARHWSSDLALDLHADASYRSSVTTQINGSASGYQALGGFTTVAASAGLHLAEHWHARLYVLNLTNQVGVSAAGAVLRNANFYPNYREQYVIRPRTIGVSLAYSLR